MYHGIINVYKEAGMTSFDVVAALRKICRQKKVGHTGTLDPAATGVLPVCLGKATKVCSLLTDSDKEYIAELRLGITTDTQDLTGTVLDKKSISALTPDFVTTVISSFAGDQEQIPPMYSAKKVNGKHLYELARDGITIERKPAKITIREIEILHMDLPDVRIRVACSKGTYIRTLCHDIGSRLGTGGVMTGLLRTKAAGYRIENAHKLDEIRLLAEKDMLSDIIRPIEDVFAGLPAVQVSTEYDKALKNGSKLPSEAFDDMTEDECRVYTSEGEFAAIYRFSPDEDLYRVKKMFLRSNK